MNFKSALSVLLSCLAIASFSAGCAGSVSCPATAPVSSALAGSSPPSVAQDPESSRAPAVSVPESSAAPVSSQNTAESFAAAAARLKSDKTVTQFAVSHGKNRAAVIRDKGSHTLAFSLLSAETGKETAVAAVPEGNLYDPVWSFDDRYLAVEEGTSVLRTTYFLRPVTGGLRAKVENTGMVWSPDSERVALAVVNKTRPVVDLELDGTTDIQILNVGTMKLQTVLRAGADVMYSPAKWDASGLTVTKTTLLGNEQSAVKVTKFSV